MNKQQYQQYLNSPHWQKMRLLKLKQVGFKCQHTGSREKLDVHHLTYARLGREGLNDLMVLQRACHDVIEAIIHDSHRPIGSLKGLKNYTHKRLRKAGFPQAR